MSVSMQFNAKLGQVNWRTRVRNIEKREAISMWRDGFDTYDIAQELGIYEAVIWNELWKWRAA